MGIGSDIILGSRMGPTAHQANINLLSFFIRLFPEAGLVFSDNGTNFRAMKIFAVIVIKQRTFRIML